MTSNFKDKDCELLHILPQSKQNEILIVLFYFLISQLLMIEPIFLLIARQNNRAHDLVVSFLVHLKVSIALQRIDRISSNPVVL